MNQPVPSAESSTARLNSRRVHLFVLALAVAIGYVWGIGSLPLFDLDEGAVSGATWAMFERGGFLTPHLDESGLIRPVLIHWLQAASVGLFGFTEWAFRLPSVLASVAWVGLVYAFADRYLGAHPAFFVGLVAATSLVTTVIGKAAIPDAVLLLFLSGALFAIFNHWATGDRRWVRWAYLALGLGFLAGGAKAMFVPALAGLAFYLVTARGRDWWRAALDWRGILIFLVAILPWSVAVWIEHGWPFVGEFFPDGDVGRHDAPSEGHSGVPLYYPLITLVALLPFTGAVLTALRHLPSDWRGVHGTPASLPLALRRFGWIWFGLALLLFPFSGTGSPRYLDAGLVGLMLVMASHLPQLRHRWLHLVPPALFLLLVLLLPWLVEISLDRIESFHVRGMLADRGAVFGPAWYLIAGGALALVIAAGVSRRWPLPWVMIPVALSCSLVVNVLVLDAVGQMRQEPVREAGLIARDLPGPLVMRDINMPSFGVYAGRGVERREVREGDLLLTRRDRAERTPGEVLYARGGYVLMRVGSEPRAAVGRSLMRYHVGQVAR